MDGRQIYRQGHHQDERPQCSEKGHPSTLRWIRRDCHCPLSERKTKFQWPSLMKQWQKTILIIQLGLILWSLSTRLMRPAIRPGRTRASIIAWRVIVRSFFHHYRKADLGPGLSEPAGTESETEAELYRARFVKLFGLRKFRSQGDDRPQII